MSYYSNQRDRRGKYFPMPKIIFQLGLNANEIAILAYLMYLENRKTYQCHPSYASIGEACGLSVNTVRKYVDSLARKGFIATEPTKVKTRDGRSHNGSLCYTILPIGRGILSRAAPHRGTLLSLCESDERIRKEIRGD